MRCPLKQKKTSVFMSLCVLHIQISIQQTTFGMWWNGRSMDVESTSWQQLCDVCFQLHVDSLL